MDNDLVLEQYLSPVSPLLAGFRLDAFSAIKPRVTHSPFSDVHSKSFPSLVDDRYITPAVLYIQVSILQVINYWNITASVTFLLPRSVEVLLHELLCLVEL